MIKQYCDACGKEMSSGTPFKYLCHIDDYFTGRMAYVDNDMNPVSGRHINVDLCAKCYNIILFPAVNTLREIQDANAEQEV